MTHEVDMSNARANIAYVGDVPWHGLGHELKPGAPIEEWRIAAGMAWNIERHFVRYLDPHYAVGSKEWLGLDDNHIVLLRSDTRKPLSVVSKGYKIVQPSDVLDFYKELVETAGFQLHTAGVLANGKRYWALAKLGKEARIMGQDQIEGYLLLATACDGTLATRCMFTSVRVVCANTLGFAVTESKPINVGKALEPRTHIRIPHSAHFDPVQVKTELGLAEGSWAKYVEDVQKMAEAKVKDRHAVYDFLVQVFGDPSKPAEEQLNSRAQVMSSVLSLYDGHGRGSAFRSADGTAWGLVNAVTEYCDHHANCQTNESRLNRSWFGDGALQKRKAFSVALAMAA